MFLLIFLLIVIIVCIYFKNKNKIPNIVHFIFGLKPQNEEFCFVYYLSVLSAYIVNKPETIYFYYHYESIWKMVGKIKTKNTSIKIRKDIITNAYR